MRLQEKLRKLIEEYEEVYEIVRSTQKFDNPFGKLIRQDIPDEISSLEFLDEEMYKVRGSCGAGRWTTVPWIAIFNKNITTSARQGVYIVYLLNKDKKELYLTLNQGVTTTLYKDKNEFTGVSKYSNKKNLAILFQNAENIRKKLNKINKERLFFDDNLTTGSLAYDAGCIYYIKYTLDSLPSDDALAKQLKAFKEAYDNYYNYCFKKHNEQSTDIELLVDNEKTPKEILECVKNYISSKGFSYEEGTIDNFYLCLKSKPFVILAGISGTGKTRLVKLFAEALGATTDNGRYKMIPVRPDWSDSSDLLGHVDLNSNFVKGAMTDFVMAAMGDKQRPYFLCLDEMNLARVEYYFSDILSIIETRDCINGEIKTDSINLEKFGSIYLPENLYIIGTVNMDETTFPFSKKVLDRANTIEFSYVNLFPDVNKVSASVETLANVANYFTKGRYINLSQCIGEDSDFVEDICGTLQEINTILSAANLHFGYRVRDEIIFYMFNNLKIDLLGEDDAMDNEIMQKILPRISGSTVAIKKVICRLFELCAGEYDSFGADSDEISEKMYKKLTDSNEDILYAKTANKLMNMMRRYEEDGFTSYWL